MPKSIENCLVELDEIKRILTEREAQHGDPKENLGRIAAYWSNYLGLNLSETDVALMMMLMKMGRLNTGTLKTDSVRDLTGYAAIATGLSRSRDCEQ